MSRYFPTPEECGRHVVFGNVPIRTYAGEQMQLSLVDLPADGVVDWHSHSNEQMGVMLAGRARFFIGEEVRELAAGEIFFIPGGVPHRVEPIDGPVQAVDFFYPIRDAYR